MADLRDEVSKTGIESIPAATPGPDDVASEEKSILPPPPTESKDGGLRAWLQVIGCFLVFFNVWGFTFSFGLFQDYYQSSLLEDKAASDIAWIGTIASFLLIVTGVISGPLFDLGHFVTMLFGGAATACFGIFMLSLCEKYYQIVLAQGICMGLGCGVLYIPGIALVSRSFKKNRTIALGLVSSGAPFGGIIYTIAFNQLIDKLGFPWTVRAMGFIMLGCYLIAFPLLLWRAGNTGDLSSGAPRKLFDKEALTDLCFWLYTWGNFFVFCGYLVPFYYMPTYAQDILATSRSFALYSIVITQGASIAGRMILGVAAVHSGVMIPWLSCAALSGILCLSWISIHTEGSFVAFAVLFGFFSGALIPLPPSIFPVVCPDPRVLGTRLGMAQAIGAIASLIGSPIAGSLVGNGGGNWYKLQLWSGVTMLFGSALLFCLWIALIKKRNSKVFI